MTVTLVSLTLMVCLLAGADTGQADAFLQDYHRHHADYRSDDNNSEDDEMFGSYHRYRAMLDREEEEHHRDEEDGGSKVEAITPRRINDVSGLMAQFAQHPETLPPVFTPPQGLASDDDADAAAFAQTWPNSSHHDRGLQRPGDGQARENGVEEEEEEGEGEEDEDEEEEEEPGRERLPAEEAATEDPSALRHRNSFIDSWLEDSAEPEPEPEPETLTQTRAQQAASLRGAGQGVARPNVQHLELDLPDSEGEESQEDTPPGRGAPEPRSEPSEGPPRLLSNVELVDTLTSVTSGARRTRGGHQPTAGRLTNGGEHRNGSSGASAYSHFNGHGGQGQGQGLPRDPHLLSNVELYSTTSSFHPTARPPRHLLSNVELASTASGSSHHPDTASSRPSRQSSANSGGRRPELEACAEIENSEDEAEFGAPQPVSARSEEVSDFFAASRPATAVNGAYDSSEEELDYQYSSGARAAAVKSRTAAGKGREPCQSVTATTEDSGLESGAKSSQDEREALSLLDSTQGQGQGQPQFFLPTEQLQASMRALQLATGSAAQAPRQTQVSHLHHQDSCLP